MSGYCESHGHTPVRYARPLSDPVIYGPEVCQECGIPLPDAGTPLPVAAPEPMSEQHLAALTYRYSIDDNGKDFAREDFQSLIAEVRRLRVENDRQIEEHNDFFRKTEALLLERARENAELLAHVDELRRGMALIQTARTLGGCSTGEAMSKSEYWARLALERTGKESAELIRTRHEVVKAATELAEVFSDEQKVHPDQFKGPVKRLYSAVAALQKVEALIHQANEKRKTGQENEGGNA